MTTTQTVEQFWREVNGDRCRWRTARKPQWCGHHQNGQHDAQQPAIQIGDQYLDTGEVIQTWATAKCCADCAVKPA